MSDDELELIGNVVEFHHAELDWPDDETLKRITDKLHEVYCGTD